MSKRKPLLILLLALLLMAGLRGTTAYAEEGGEGETKAKPQPVNKWWDIPKVKSPEDANQPSLLQRWLPQVFAPPEPGTRPSMIRSV